MSEVPWTAPLEVSRANKDALRDIMGARVCLLCGVVVFEDYVDLHTSWHEGLDEIVTTLRAVAQTVKP